MRATASEIENEIERARERESERARERESESERRAGERESERAREREESERAREREESERARERESERDHHPLNIIFRSHPHMTMPPQACLNCLQVAALRAPMCMSD